MRLERHVPSFAFFTQVLSSCLRGFFSASICSLSQTASTCGMSCPNPSRRPILQCVRILQTFTHSGFSRLYCLFSASPSRLHFSIALWGAGVFAKRTLWTNKASFVRKILGKLEHKGFLLTNCWVRWPVQPEQKNRPPPPFYLTHPVSPGGTFENVNYLQSKNPVSACFFSAFS